MTSTECFTASTLCPRCGTVGVHWLRASRRTPKIETLAARGHRRLAVTQDLFSALHNRPALFDPDDAEVVRECRTCGREWGQR